MVTTGEYKANGKYMGAETFYGLSTDTMPTSCGNGSVFIEMDTGIGYFFDAENSEWLAPGATTDEGGEG